SDLQLMSAVDVQRVLRDVDAKTLAAALSEAPTELEELVYRNLSKNAKGILSQEREYLGDPDAETVAEAQERVGTEIGRLVDAEKISPLDPQRTTTRG
ncbi:MAG: FliG C-terminal domain-containing protein, partial [Spirochaetaceae bacterium]